MTQCHPVAATLSQPSLEIDSPTDQEHSMKTKIASMAMAIAAMTATAPAYAEKEDIAQLAEYTGLSERKVKMILGCHTCHAEYSYTYQRSLEKFQKALGPENYSRLMSGQPVTLDDGAEVRVATIDQL